MTTTARPNAWRTLLALILSFLVAVGGSLVLVAPANAATGASAVTGGSVNWGYKASFRTYVGNQTAAMLPIGALPAGERITVSEGAAFDTAASPSSGTNAETLPYVFPVTGGTVTDADNLTIVSSGLVHFNFPSHCFTAVIGEPTIVVDGGLASLRGTLQVTTTNGAGICASYSDAVAGGADVVISTGTASVDLADDGSSVTVSLAGLTVSEAASAAMAGFAGVGDSLDNLTVTAQLLAPSEPEPSNALLSVSKTSGIDPSGESITITGTGYEINDGGIYAQIGWIKEGEWTPLSSDDTRSANRTNAYSALVGSGFPGQPTWNIAEDGTGSFAWTTTVTKAALQAKAKDGFTLGVFTLGSHSNWIQPANERFVEISFAGSDLKVSKTSGLSSAGAEITITGTGYEINPGGIYAQVGWVKAGEWTPLSSADTRAANRTNAYSALIGSGFPGQPEWVVADDGTGSFTWTTTITKADLDAKAKDGFTLGVFTLGSHSNWVQPANEQFVPIAFAVAQLTVSKATGLDPEGEELTVNGSGYQIVSGGIYAQIGWVKEGDWTPISSSDTRAGNRSSAYSAAVGSGYAGQPAWAVAADGSGSFAWTTTITKAELDAKAKDGFTLGVFTLGSHSNWVQPANEVFVPISFATPSTPENPNPGNPGSETPVTAGSLTWGVKESFRSYVTGPIAHGTISVTGASSAGGAYFFGQAAGGSYTVDSGVGTSNYTGSVRFTGHNGELDLTLSNPSVQITSATSGVLTVVSNGARVSIANLNLAASARSTSNGAVTYKNVPATLTSQGVSVFALNGSGFYAAGTALDPVTFTIGAPAKAAGGTTIIASFTPAVTRTPAATPPATTGLGVEGELVEGGEVTITADGFEPNEEGILVVIYSEPTVLASNVTADASGVATWTGALPEGLTGEHTLTLQGSVNRGAVVTIGGAVVTATSVDSCDVTNATLSWGFKEAFRAYISGAIAHGEWTVADGASYETPLFGWNDGAGSYDSAASTGEVSFTGSVRFTGHDGVLDTTIANPRIEFVSADKAYLVLDITGTTQEGEAIAQTGVRFVELDLAAGASQNADGVYSVDGAPAALTDLGAAAFGTYEAGTEFDPVSFTVPLADDCGAVAAPISAPGDVEPISAGPDLSWLLWVALAVIVLLVAALAIVLTRRGTARKA